MPPGNNHKKVMAGQRYVPSARMHNDLVDLLSQERVKEGDRSGNPPGGGEQTTVPVRNNTDDPMGRFSVVGIESSVFSPSDAEPQWLRHTIFEASLPQSGVHDQRYAVLLEPIAPGKIGKACISGIVKARVTGEGSDFASIVDGNGDALNIDEGGSALVLWAEPGSDERWAVVRLGGGSGGSSSFYAIITDARPVSGAFNQWHYSWLQVAKISEGYGGWGAIAGGLEGDWDGDARGYNYAEDMNAQTGVQGHGIDVDELPDGFDSVPCPVGQIVRMYPVSYSVEVSPALGAAPNGGPTGGGQDDGEGGPTIETYTEYWFNFGGNVDGSC